jgi:hypothetical protein
MGGHFKQCQSEGDSEGQELWSIRRASRVAAGPAAQASEPVLHRGYLREDKPMTKSPYYRLPAEGVSLST